MMKPTKVKMQNTQSKAKQSKRNREDAKRIFLNSFTLINARNTLRGMPASVERDDKILISLINTFMHKQTWL